MLILCVCVCVCVWYFIVIFFFWVVQSVILYKFLHVATENVFSLVNRTMLISLDESF